MEDLDFSNIAIIFRVRQTWKWGLRFWHVLKRCVEKNGLELGNHSAVRCVIRVRVPAVWLVTVEYRSVIGLLHRLEQNLQQLPHRRDAIGQYFIDVRGGLHVTRTYQPTLRCGSYPVSLPASLCTWAVSISVDRLAWYLQMVVEFDEILCGSGHCSDIHTYIQEFVTFSVVTNSRYKFAAQTLNVNFELVFTARCSIATWCARVILSIYQSVSRYVCHTDNLCQSGWNMSLHFFVFWYSHHSSFLALKLQVKNLKCAIWIWFYDGNNARYIRRLLTIWCRPTT